MRPRVISRRQVLFRALTVSAGAGQVGLLAACGGSVPPTLAPVKPTEAPKPVAAAATKPVAAPAATTASAAPAVTSAPAVTAAASAPSKPAAVPAAQAPTVAAPGTAAPAAGAQAAAGAPKRGGTLKAVVQNDFVTMFPVTTTGPTAWQCFDWLVRWRRGADGRWGAQPGLAESWELSEKAGVFKIRRGVKFHDGSDVNAEAVRWNVETWIKHPKSIARSNLQAVAQDTPAEVIDDYTVKINLKGPAGSLLAALSDATETTAIYSKAAYEKLNDDGARLQAVGSGPFVFENFQSGAQFNLKKNDNYWEKGADGSALPYLDKIQYRFVPDDSVRLNELRSGNADIMGNLRGRDVPAAKGDPNLVYIEDRGGGTRYRFLFNAKKPPFGQAQGEPGKKLRQAIQYALDREAMAKALGGGTGIVQKYDLTPGVIGYDESLPYYGFDLDKAKQLMKESGLATPVNVRLTVISREADQQQAQVMQQMLDKIGVKVSIEALERVAWGTKVRKNNDFEMATQQTGAPIDPDTSFTLAWLPEGPASYIRADEPAIQKLLAEGRSTYDVQKRHDIYKQVQMEMYNAAWWGVMWLLPANWLLNKRVKNVPPMTVGHWREDSFWLDG